jgi:transcriptional regulator with XRE-family HTH domain
MRNYRPGNRLYLKDAEPCFKTRFEDLLWEHNLSNRRFANEFMICQSAVSAYVRGDRIPDLNLFKEMCDFFNVSADWLLGRSDNRNVKEDSNGKNR